MTVGNCDTVDAMLEVLIRDSKACKFFTSFALLLSKIGVLLQFSSY